LKVTKANKYAPIRSMGADKVDRMEVMLVQGMSCPKVAKKIQDEWKLLQDIKTGTLTKQILRYKKEVLDSKLHSKLLIKTTEDNKDTKGTDVKQYKTVIKTTTKLDVIDALEDLILLQNHRVAKVFTMEESLPTLMGTLRYELKELRDMIKQLSDLKFDLGLVKRQPKKIVGSIDLHSPEVLEDEDVLSKMLADKGAMDDATTEVFAALEAMVKEAGEIEDGEFTDCVPTDGDS